MATPALITVLAVAVLTAAALVVVTVTLVRRLRELGRRLGAVSDRLQPQLDLLSREAEIAQREVERLSSVGDGAAWDEAGRRTLSGPGIQVGPADGVPRHGSGSDKGAP